MICFTCPRCDAALKVPGDRAGEKINCPECQRAVDVPESLDDEPPAAESDARRWPRVPLWVWGAVAFALVALVIGIVIGFVTSGAKDGLTRAERAELEVKMKRDLPGIWEQDGTDTKTVYTFTDNGRFEAARYRFGKKAGGHVGTWSVSGSRMTLQVTESADDLVKTGRPYEMAISDVKSESGTVFKFTISRSEPVSESLTLARPRVDELSTDEGKTRRLTGAWEEHTPPGWAAYDFRADGTLRITLHQGTGDVWSTGTWRVESGSLKIRLLEHTNGPYPDSQKPAVWLFKEAAPNRFVIENATTGARQVLVKR